MKIPMPRPEVASRRRTPWGVADSETTYAPGIVFYATPSHGGFRLDAALNRVVPAQVRSETQWYEEDCEWAIVALCFPSAFTTNDQWYAAQAAKMWFPEFWDDWNFEPIKVPS